MAHYSWELKMKTYRIAPSMWIGFYNCYIADENGEKCIGTIQGFNEAIDRCMEIVKEKKE
jgi:hypothetical protein